MEVINVGYRAISLIDTITSKEVIIKKRTSYSLLATDEVHVNYKYKGYNKYRDTLTFTKTVKKGIKSLLEIKPNEVISIWESTDFMGCK